MKNFILAIIMLPILAQMTFGEEKTINVHYITDDHGDYRIKINANGLIDSVDFIAKTNPAYSKKTRITVTGEKITLQQDNSELKLAIGEIIMDEASILVKGHPRSLFTRNENEGGYLQIMINPARDIIYEYDEVKLVRVSDKSLEEVFIVNPGRYSAYTYSNNTLLDDYLYKSNTMQRYDYADKGDRILITGEYLAGESYVEPAEIYGGSLFSYDDKINTINYFIVTSVNALLASRLFPLFFLEEPFVEAVDQTSASAIDKQDTPQPIENAPETVFAESDMQNAPKPKEDEIAETRETEVVEAENNSGGETFETGGQERTDSTKEHTSGKYVLFLLIALCLAMIAGALYFFIKHKKRKDSQTKL